MNADIIKMITMIFMSKSYSYSIEIILWWTNEKIYQKKMSGMRLKIFETSMMN
jgi:hypothetical protein